MPEEVHIHKSMLIVVVAVFAVGGWYVVTTMSLFGDAVSGVPSRTIEEKFALLSGANTNACSGPDMLQRIDADQLQGSCCSAMDFHRYKEQVEGLKKYAHIKMIPSDPYDIPLSLAETLLEFQKSIMLIPEQQTVYDDAAKMSHEGGPCCCTCWRWYAFEGLAKYLITEYNFNAEQIAEVWDLEDGCGGSGHNHES